MECPATRQQKTQASEQVKNIMEKLTAEEMGFPKDYRNAYTLTFALKGGYPVGNPMDASPGLQNVTPQGETEPLYKSVDNGQTWWPVGEWHRNKFDDWSLRWNEEREPHDEDPDGMYIPTM